ncbi:ATP-binding protein, partial [Streptomyces griseoluteus]|uniref:ATP-binding protein n=1 Tax=Streptomyces griseoluteus TaxID=29306 RepID=UPI00369D37D8
MNGLAVHERPTESASWRIALPHTAAAVPVARALVRSALAEVEHMADCDTAELLTAELVANAVEHTAGSGPIELVVELRPGGCQ